MYWNLGIDRKCTVFNRINRNMRCIEIIAQEPVQAKATRLIETWDVLKLQIKIFWTSKIKD